MTNNAPNLTSHNSSTQPTALKHTHRIQIGPWPEIRICQQHVITKHLSCNQSQYTHTLAARTPAHIQGKMQSTEYIPIQPIEEPPTSQDTSRDKLPWSQTKSQNQNSRSPSKMHTTQSPHLCPTSAPCRYPERAADIHRIYPKIKKRRKRVCAQKGRGVMCRVG